MVKRQHLRGVVCMLGGSAMLTLNDAVMKWVGAGHPVGQIISIRGVFGLLFILLLVHRPGGGGFRSLLVSNFRGPFVWAILLVVSTFLFITGLQHLPLADATSLTFAGPLFVVVLAPFLLGESVDWPRRLGVMMGFAGVMFILKPGAEAFRWAAMLPLTVAFVEALRDMLARRMVTKESSLSLVFTSVSAVTISGLATLPWGWPPITTPEIGLLALAACLQSGAHFFMVESFRYGEATLISPFRYASVLWALALGFMLWQDRPDVWMVVGVSLVIGSGLYILRKKNKQIGR